MRMDVPLHINAFLMLRVFVCLFVHAIDRGIRMEVVGWHFFFFSFIWLILDFQMIWNKNPG